jgi:hypothetical protein
MTTFQIDFNAMEPRPEGGRPDRYNGQPKGTNASQSIMQMPINFDSGLTNLHLAFKDEALMKKISGEMQRHGMYFTSLASVVNHEGEGEDRRSVTSIVVTGEKFQPARM